MSQNPYASPSASSSATPNQAPQNRSGLGYKPLHTLAKILLFAIGVICLGNISVSAIETVGNFMFPSFSDPNAPLSSETERVLILANAGMGLLILPAFILAAVVTPMFFYRANANLHSLGVRGLQHTPGWCAGYWFIPIVNLFKPYQVATEINENSRAHRSNELPSTKVGVWWACWIIGNILSNIETRLALNGVNLAETGLVLSWVSTLLTCAAGFFFIKTVFSFADAQEEMRSGPKQPNQKPVF